MYIQAPNIATIERVFNPAKLIGELLSVSALTRLLYTDEARL